MSRQTRAISEAMGAVAVIVDQNSDVSDSFRE